MSAVVLSALTIGASGALAAQEETATPVPPETETPTQSETASVTFDIQTSNGTAVVANSAVLPEGGFVAVYVVNESSQATDENVTKIEQVTNATIGDRLGNSTYLEAGSHENVTVVLDQTPTGNQTLIAIAVRDANENQQFDAPAVDTAEMETPAAETPAMETAMETDRFYLVDDRLVADSALVVFTDAQETATSTETVTPES